MHVHAHSRADSAGMSMNVHLLFTSPFPFPPHRVSRYSKHAALLKRDPETQTHTSVVWTNIHGEDAWTVGLLKEQLIV